MKLFCWHDWTIFNAPTKNVLIRKVGSRFLYAFYQKQESGPDLALGHGNYVEDFSDLVCYKCNGKKLNLTNILNKRQEKLNKEKASQQKKLRKETTFTEKVASIKLRKKEAVLAARKEMEKKKERLTARKQEGAA